MISKEDSWKIFDRISHKYDRINRIISFGIDRYWRKKLTKYAPKKPLVLLDLATGTADQILHFFHQGHNIEKAYGIDLSQEMLEIAKKKLLKKSYKNKVILSKGDALCPDFEEEKFDCITMVFGIRNVADPQKCLKEMFRLLKKGGRVCILEFSLPKNILIKKLHLFYLRHILPKLGNFLSKDPYAYSYLNQTIETFPYGEKFCNWLKLCSFKHVQNIPLSFGIVTLYVAEK